MAASTDRAHLRLAELVAALSLGIDLGFGQPMEHVLRQCLIASRLAERVGLDEQERADVYYTALLVNVGCHTDAHEQAKWMGDDIAMKADKYEYEFRSGGLPAPIRRRPATAARRLWRSWSYLSAFSAMSSPIHLACSWASVWQPTFTSSAV